MIRLVAPCARSRGLCLSSPGVRCACSVGRPSVSTLCLVLLRLTSSRTTPFRVSAARSRAPLLFLSQRRSRAALLPSPAASRGAAGLLLPVPAPRGVGGAPRGALRERSRLRSATTVLARHGPSRATGRRLSALHRGDLWTARPRVTYPTVPRTMARLPAAGRKASRSDPAASRWRLHRAFGTPHPAPPQNVSGDAPHERGWGVYSIDAVSSQVCI